MSNPNLSQTPAISEALTEQAIIENASDSGPDRNASEFEDDLKFNVEIKDYAQTRSNSASGPESMDVKDTTQTTEPYLQNGKSLSRLATKTGMPENHAGAIMRNSDSRPHSPTKASTASTSELRVRSRVTSRRASATQIRTIQHILAEGTAPVIESITDSSVEEAPAPAILNVVLATTTAAVVAEESVSGIESQQPLSKSVLPSETLKFIIAPEETLISPIIKSPIFAVAVSTPHIGLNGDLSLLTGDSGNKDALAIQRIRGQVYREATHVLRQTRYQEALESRKTKAAVGSHNIGVKWLTKQEWKKKRKYLKKGPGHVGHDLDQWRNHISKPRLKKKSVEIGPYTYETRVMTPPKEVSKISFISTVPRLPNLRKATDRISPGMYELSETKQIPKGKLPWIQEMHAKLGRAVQSLHHFNSTKTASSVLEGDLSALLTPTTAIKEDKNTSRENSPDRDASPWTRPISIKSNTGVTTVRAVLPLVLPLTETAMTPSLAAPKETGQLVRGTGKATHAAYKKASIKSHPLHPFCELYLLSRS